MWSLNLFVQEEQMYETGQKLSIKIFWKRQSSSLFRSLAWIEVMIKCTHWLNHHLNCTLQGSAWEPKYLQFFKLSYFWEKLFSSLQNFEDSPNGGVLFGLLLKLKLVELQNVIIPEMKIKFCWYIQYFGKIYNIV